MQLSERPKGKSSSGGPEGPRASLALRLDRAAGDLNPFLLVVTIGLLLLNITLYLGMMAARQPFVWAQPMHQAGPETTAAPVAPATWQSLPGDRR